MAPMECHPILLAFGNPLLDMTVVVKDTSLHERFNLPEDGQLEVSSEQYQIFDIVKKRTDIQYTAGGCALNTLRVFTWVLGEKYKSVFVGGLGEDEKAEKLKSILSGCGVIMNYVIVKEKPTGTCVALVLGSERCLCADIGAAAVCPPENIFLQNLDLVPPLDSASVIYLEGYFITHSFDVALRIARHCNETGRPFVFNLCGSYVCENHSEELSELLPYVDIVFGYYDEFKTLEQFVSIPDLCEKYLKNQKNIVHDLDNMFKCFSGQRLPIKNKGILLDGKCGNGQVTDSILPVNNHSNHISEGKYLPPWNGIKNKKLVVVTRGGYPILYTKDKEVFEQEIPSLNPEKIVDTTGAGDSFVGGFLAAAAKGLSLESCLECGVWSAQQILKEKGCTIPKRAAEFL